MAEHLESVESFLSQWAAAEQAGNTETLDGLMTSDFVGIGPMGFSLAKPDWLARHHQGLHYEALNLQDIDVRAYGDVAVATARMLQSGTYQDHPVPEALRATCVVALEQDQRRLLAIHLSFIAGTPGAPPLPGGARPQTTEADRA